MGRKPTYCNFKLIVEQSIEEVMEDADLFDKPTLMRMIKNKLLRWISLSSTQRSRRVLDIKKIREAGL